MDQEPRTKTRRRWLLWLGGGVLVVAAILGGALAWLIPHFEPMLRERVVRALEAKFKSPVQLDALHISVLDGLQVEGGGLRVYYPSSTQTSSQTMLIVRSFQFRSTLHEILAPTIELDSARVQGVELIVPPPGFRSLFPRGGQSSGGRTGEGFFIHQIFISDLAIVIQNKVQGKPPLVFDAGNLTLTDVGPERPFQYDAIVHNPKPVGDVHAVGHFGPWQRESPRDTALDGNYTFTNVDLGSLKGIGGSLSSTGKFYGTLGRILVDGTADSPNLSLTVSGHPLPLHAEFHAIVDATNGDTYLQPVNARLAHSQIVARGSITRKIGVKGHDIELEVNIGPGRIDDMLAFGTKTYPPVLRGELTTHSHLSIPPGPERVTQKMRLNGSFTVEQGVFNNTKLQQQINGLSERARDRAEYASPQMAEAITSNMKGSFNLANEQMQIRGVTYQIPGATVNVDGQYGLDGKTLDFHGLVRTQATASQMVGGWQQLLVMPFDRFLKKNGAGVEVPFTVGGTQSDPKLDLDYGRMGKSVPSR